MTALETSLAFHRAWMAGDIDTALQHVAPDVVCDAPAGRITGIAEFRAFIEPFSRLLTGSHLHGAFGDDTTSVLFYDTATRPVPHAPGAEHHTVTDGRITHVRIVFDRVPFEAARAAAR
ncbi:nuclear transport factor 2 family protein [Pseudonocardia sp. CA-107938]|uniref:nuclear transport factor 2 family protein n=1 Tax=Pseudonocardia sp. CA-107938 TaxID=3240021 RepID=UPI003D8E926C